MICAEKIEILKGVKKLADYKKMYSMLFNKITDVIEELQSIQVQTEDLYIDSPEPKLIDINAKIDENDAKK